jgi:DNA-binding YbaB/EbfC family protein
MGNPFGKMPGGMGGMVKAMEAAMKQAQVAEAELANEHIEATSGGGIVKCVVTGKGDLVEIKIGKDAVDPNDIQLLEDLVVTAVRDALEKSTARRNERLQKIVPTQGLGLPGLF